MSGLALYRKYRSQAFGEVVGQQHVVQTLQAALASGHISHAYLFTGPRGVGKTTVARLLARSLNCTSEGKVKPCGKCINCKVELGTHLDLIEIDAASNRRIDEIRDLRDKIGLAPALGKYKVYIIDEVHMLTTEAFNALLKTLEEPPPHAVFILATTEAHKLPSTVVSRTQRFGFRAISEAELVKHLSFIAKQEQITIDQPSLKLLALASRGSFRDGISLLDQLASLGSDIDEELVRQMLGWSDLESIEQFCLAIAGGHTGEALVIVDRLWQQGAQTAQLLDQVIALWREVLLASVGANHGQASDKLTKQFQGKLTPDRIVATIDVFQGAAKSPWPHLALEAAIVRLTTAVKPVAVIASEVEPAPSAVIPASEPESEILNQVQDDNSAEATGSPVAEGDWDQFLLRIKTVNHSLAALLQACQVDMTAERVLIKTPFNFHLARLQEAKNAEAISQNLAKVFGKRLIVKYELSAAPSGEPAPVNSTNELVSSALEILGGEIVE